VQEQNSLPGSVHIVDREAAAHNASLVSNGRLGTMMRGAIGMDETFKKAGIPLVNFAEMS
jgi:hypothetical protein